jgi:phytanoyl-CoA hydroxylase
MLTAEHKQFWEKNGYLVLPRFFSAERLEWVLRTHQDIWDVCPSNVVVDDLVTGRRCSMNSLSQEEKTHPFKVNDLYLDYAEVRHLSLDKQLVEVLSQLLPDAPVLCNTLSLDYGTQQSLHIDSLYMTPLTEGHLIATWIALEDCHPDAGPLAYLPGSHKIPLYHFSDGSFHEIVEEKLQWQTYMQQQIQEYGLKEECFLPKKGDVFIWHANFMHGGSKIADPKLTRKSLVSHYFSQADCLLLGSKLHTVGQAYWMDRPPLSIPEETTIATAETPPPVTENPDPLLPQSSAKRLKQSVTHIFRTTLHYFRIWKRSVFDFPQ